MIRLEWRTFSEDLGSAALRLAGRRPSEIRTGGRSRSFLDTAPPKFGVLCIKLVLAGDHDHVSGRTSRVEESGHECPKHLE